MRFNWIEFLLTVIVAVIKIDDVWSAFTALLFYLLYLSSSLRPIKIFFSLRLFIVATIIWMILIVDVHFVSFITFYVAFLYVKIFYLSFLTCKADYLLTDKLSPSKMPCKIIKIKKQNQFEILFNFASSIKFFCLLFTCV